MSYQSFLFLLFSAIVLFLYYIVGTKRQKWILLLANIAFFVISGAKYLPFILVTICSTFFAGKKMGAVYQTLDMQLAECGGPEEKKRLRSSAKARAKRILILSLAVSVGLLVVCKYTGFIIVNVNSIVTMIGLSRLPLFKMILPIGISFYTFMAVSYVLDIYWRRYEAEQDFVLYAAYLSYFPHVVQGPIDRFDHIKKQVQGGVKADYHNLTYGAQLALWGLFKKLVVADRLGLFVNTIYDNWRDYTGIILVIATVLYSIQIYADFSGCIDIVAGISEMFGIKLDKNFDHPYFSKTMPEFWRRWHISLGEWFKDYIYYPVSASSLVKRVKKSCKAKNNKRAGELFASCFPAFVVWLITGIWHGAAWKFVAWGLFHASLIIMGTLCSDFNSRLTEKLHIQTDTFSWKLWQMTRTFTLCCIGRVFFRAESLRAAIGIFANACKELGVRYILSADLFTYGLDLTNILMAIMSIGVLWVVDMMQERMCVRDALAKQNLVFRWMILYAGIFAVLIFGIYGAEFNASEFIYEQF